MKKEEKRKIGYEKLETGLLDFGGWQASGLQASKLETQESQYKVTVKTGRCETQKEQMFKVWKQKNPMFQFKGSQIEVPP